MTAYERSKAPVRGILRRFSALFLSAVMLLAGTAAVRADNTVVGRSSAAVDRTAVSDGGLTEYGDYLTENSHFEAVESDVTAAGGTFAAQQDSGAKSAAEYKGRQNVLMWESGNGSVSWRFEIQNAGFYNLLLVYLPLKSGTNMDYGLLIDGAVPFDGADNLIFTRDWVDAADHPDCDELGNETAPEQIETGEYVTRRATDSTGAAPEPYCFALSAGVHTVTLVGKGYAAAVAELALVAPEKTQPYKTVSQGYTVTEDAAVEPIVIHAEQAYLKSDKSLIPLSANGNAGMYPSDPHLTKLNCIGASNWNAPGQTITWKFEVKKAGYYSFGARYKQNELVGGESWRRLKIDGETPFDEAKELRFPYGTGWQEYLFGDGENPYYIYLDEGNHTLSLEVTLGEFSEFYSRLSKVLTALGDMYLKIVMITGETVDVNRDYELFTQIPTFTEVLSDASAELGAISAEMQSLSGNGNQYTAAINNMKRIIDRMLDAKYIAHIYVKDYYTNYTTLCSWLDEMRKMPLALDEMQLVYAGCQIDWQQPGFFQRLIFGAQRLLYSYTEDYRSESSDEDRVTLKLWVNWGRDQAMALDSMIRDSFTAETGIDVELQIVNNSLINGLLANNFPDLQLNLSRTDPVNFGMRGALLDLTEFSDYEQILERFADGADVPYWYNGALYALPDTQTFFCLFYRKDVFAQLGLQVPKTWEDFLYCATLIQRYNMSVYVPYTQIAASTTVNAGIGSLHLYPTLMLQNGLSLYNEKQNATDLLSEKGLAVFEEWTAMYTDYGYLKEADFYNRFRNGSMPMGIAPYSTYMTIYSAAPEIKDRWSVANVPGTADGNNFVAGSGTGCAIVKRSAHHAEAWEFLKWWTSAETQTRFSNHVESILGPLGRIATSNVEAFQKLSWNPDDLEKLLAQWETVREVPEVPGSYYLSRAVDQAFWSVINDNVNPKDAVTEWSKTADSEIARKIKEYS